MEAAAVHPKKKAADAGEQQSASVTKSKPRKKVGRSKSMGSGVRRILGEKWSQRLQSHLKNKQERGPSQHQPQQSSSKLIVSSSSWAEEVGEGSNPNLFLEEEMGEPLQDNATKGQQQQQQQQLQSSTGRLDQSITGDLLSAAWLLSPKKSSKKDPSAINNSNNNSTSNMIHNSYSNLQDEEEEENDNNTTATTTTNNNNNNNNKSILPFSGVGSSSTLFTGVNDFLNMSSGPLTMSFANASSAATANKEEFDVVRRRPPQRQSSSSNNNQKGPSRLSAIWGNHTKNGRPVLAPKLAKQLTDFRLRRQQGKPYQVDEADEDGDEIRDGTEHFSVTTEKLSAHTITSRMLDGDDTSICSEDEDDDDPAKSPRPSTTPPVIVRHLRSSSTGDFRHVENLLSNQKQRYEMMNEIEMRREKFKDKLQGTNNNKKKNKESIAPETIGALMMGQHQNRNHRNHDSSMALDFAQDLHESLLMSSSAGNLMMGSASKLLMGSSSLMGSANITQMAMDLHEMDERLSVLNNKVVTNTGRRPRRAQSTSAAVSRSSSLPEALDSLGALPSTKTNKKIKKSSSSGQQPQPQEQQSSSNLAVVLDDDLFDDDDSVFFGNKAGGKKQASTKKRTTTGSASLASLSDATKSTATSKSSAPILLPKPTALPKLGRSRTTSSVDNYRNKKMSASMTAFPAATNVSAVAQTEGSSNSARSQRTTSVRSEWSGGGGGGSARSERTSLSVGSKSNGVLTTPATTTSEVSTGNSSHNGSLRSQRTADDSINHVNLTPKRAALSRRATVGVTGFEKSFQIVNGVLDFGQDGSGKTEEDEQTAHSTGKSRSKKKGKKAANDATALFHQSFALESLISPARGKRASVSNMYNVAAEFPANLMLENSFSLLSTVEEVSRDEKRPDEQRHRPKRRNSLPTGSSHGPGVDLMMSPIAASCKQRVGKGETTQKPRRGRRSGLAAEMKKSIVQVDLQGKAEDSGIHKSRSGASLATMSTTESKLDDEDDRTLATATKMLAPSKADALTSTRRRASVKVEQVIKSEPKETTVDKIRMRRRASTRVTSSTNEKGLLKQRPGIVSRSQSTPVDATKPSSNETVESVVPDAVQRRKDRRSRRNPSQSKYKHEDASWRRTTPQEGAAPSTAPSGDARKRRSLTPNGTRRRRRTTLAEASQPKTPTARKERIVRRSSISGGPRSPVFNDPTVPRVRGARGGPGMDESAASQTGRSTRRSAQPRRQTSMDESATTRSEKSEAGDDYDDDDSIEPTPKPQDPPCLPLLSTRSRSKSPEVGVASSRRSMKPRRHRSRETSPKMKEESRSRRHRSDGHGSRMDESDIVSPTARRKTRTRRHTAHEALKGGEQKATVLSQDASEDMQGSPEHNYSTSMGKDITRPGRTMDKKLMAELCKSPNRANRFRRRKTHDEESGGAKDEMQKSPKTPGGRRSRRSKGDDGADAKAVGKSPYRRRRTEVVDTATPLSSRLRRVKTVDSTLPTLDLDASEGEAAEEEEGDKQQAITSNPLLDGLSF
ncbi:expressed unknown protein [Seminavis robusta]|uniref:Uncharacterized protein n=1 Tax=Seminavis robusta TaxID=568900 RepID=A0A9N8EG14_9STRA|nr:expressed unknown protein [Seminavis robusta]|eukprot:Sro881_g215290.1 n/a (1519) ;mRNA; f:36611-41167